MSSIEFKMISYRFDSKKNLCFSYQITVDREKRLVKCIDDNYLHLIATKCITTGHLATLVYLILLLNFINI